MKKWILSGLSLMILQLARAQQQPHYTQYIINNYLLNPAVAGIENYTDVKIGHRHQWVGVEDAPVTTYLTIHMPIGKKDDRLSATSFDIPGENPRGRSYWQDYTAAAPHHGLGFKIINDRTGPINRLSGYMSYAYHIGISAQTSLAAGFEMGIQHVHLNSARLDFGQTNPVDPAVINNGSLNRVRPDFGAGIWVYSASYFLGLSAQQLIGQKIYFSDKGVNNTGSSFVPHLFATAGYRFLLDDDFSVLPSIMVKYIQPGNTGVDFNGKLQYRDNLWAGVGYRLSDGFTAMLGMNVSNTFNLSYAYDYTTGPLRTYSRGTHEIVLGFLLGNTYGDWCPRNIW